MKVKTSELQGVALDWAAAKCEGRKEPELLNDFATAWFTWGNVHYSTNWAQAGPIIEREGIAIDCIRCNGNIDGWQAANMVANDENWDAGVQYGPTPLVAAMRCYVASKLGDEVEVPDETVS
jgi:hypothetical protein